MHNKKHKTYSFIQMLKKSRTGKAALFFLALLFMPLKSIAYDGSDSFTRLNIDFDASLSDNMLSGPGQDRSFLTEGWKYMGTMNANLSGQQEEFKYQLRLGLRSTNDKRTDPIPFSLTNAQGTFEYRQHKLLLGDVFEVFSRYSLSSSLKGANYRYEDGSMPSLSLIAGRAVPRWESWWKDPDALSINREAYGASIKHKIMEDMNAGISYVQSADYDAPMPGTMLYDNQVAALTLDYKPIPGLTLAGEAALSSTNLTNGMSASEAGQAFRIEAIGDQDPSRVVLEYERVSPNFESLLGSAIKDRESSAASWRYKASQDITVNSSFRWNRNSLHDSARSTNAYRPQIGVTIRRIASRRYSALDLKAKLDYKDAPAFSRTDWFTSANYRDRFGIYDIDTGLGLSSYNASKSDSNQLDSTARLAISTRKSFGSVIIRPNISASANYADDDEAAVTRKVYEYSAGSVIDFPEQRISANFRIGQNFMRAPDADAEAMYLTAQLNYRPEALKGGNFYMKFTVNDYEYQATANNYAEKVFTIGLNLPFQHEWR